MELQICICDLQRAAGAVRRAQQVRRPLRATA